MSKVKETPDRLEKYRKLCEYIDLLSASNKKEYERRCVEYDNRFKAIKEVVVKREPHPFLAMLVPYGKRVENSVEYVYWIGDVSKPRFYEGVKPTFKETIVGGRFSADPKTYAARIDSEPLVRYLGLDMEWHEYNGEYKAEGFVADGIAIMDGLGEIRDAIKELDCHCDNNDEEDED